MSKKTTTMIALLCVCLLCASAGATVGRWPVIQAMERTVTFRDAGQNDADTRLIIFLKNIAGSPAYELECHNGNYDGPSVINFSGDFQCALFGVRGSAVTTGNLLAADSKNELSTDWWNRGRMRPEQLKGDCLNYPEYSTNREFKLRGMSLLLRFSGMKWSDIPTNGNNNPKLMNFTVTVIANSDPSNDSARAEIPNGPSPPDHCYP